MAKVRINLKKLQEYDRKHGESIVRLLEMSVENLLTQQAYSIQFWRDVELYGLAEAYLYLRNQEDKVWVDKLKIVDLGQLVKDILDCVQSDKAMHCEDCGERLPCRCKCECGNPSMGFDCSCEWSRLHPGKFPYSCDFCGIYTASEPKCNKCQVE